MNPSLCLCWLSSLVFATAAFSQHNGDIGLVIEDQKLSSVVITGGQYSGNEQVFTASFGDSGFDFFTQNPGWNAAPGTFIPGTSFTWDAVSGLKKFEPGVGFGSTTATLRVSFSSTSVTIGEEPVPGFSLQVQPDGGFHKHPNFFLQGVSGSDPEPGAYLLETRLEISEPGVTASDSVFVVFNNMAPEHQIEAVAYLEDSIKAACPFDVNGDSVVSFADLLAVLADWGCESCPATDVDGDGSVGFSDVLGVVASWGDC